MNAIIQRAELMPLEAAGKKRAMSCGTTMCHNLRPAGTKDRALVPAIAYEKIAEGLKDYRLQGTLTHPDKGICIILTNGRDAVAVTEEGERIEVGRTSSNITGFHPMKKVSRGYFSTEEGLERIMCTDNGFELEDAWGVPPSPKIMKGDESEVWTTVEEAKLTRTYERQSSRLAATDNRRLTADLLKAYNEIMDSAFHDNRSPEPLLLRYRWLDNEGRTVYEGPVKLLCPSSNNFSNEMSCSISEGERNSFNISAIAFSIEIETAKTEESWRRRVSTLIIEGASWIATVDGGKRTTEARVAQNGTLIRFYMPGAAVNMTTDKECRRYRAINTLAEFDKRKTTLLRIDDPFGANGSKVYRLPLTQMLKGEASTIAKTSIETANHSRYQRKEGHELLWQRLSLPHRFSAMQSGVNGEATLWGDIRLKLFDGWDVRDVATEFDRNASWRGYVCVEMADGERKAVWSGQGATDAPTALSPLLYYPSEDAIAIEIEIATGAGTSHHRVDLMPIAGQGIACNPDFDFDDVRLVFESGRRFSVPVGKLPDEHYSELVVSTDFNDELKVVDTAKINSSGIIGLTAATASSSAWDFDRHRFYTFSKDGIFMAVVSARGKISALQHIAKSAIASKSMITRDMKEIAIVECDRLLRLTGTNIKEGDTVAAGVKAISAGNRDTIIARDDGMIAIVPFNETNKCFIDDRIKTADVLATQNSHVILSNEGILFKTTLPEGNGHEVEWECRFHVGRRIKTDGLILGLTGVAIDVTIELTEDYGASNEVASKSIGTFTLRGCLKSCLKLPLRICLKGYLRVRLKGKVSCDARLEGVEIVKHTES